VFVITTGYFMWQNRKLRITIAAATSTATATVPYRTLAAEKPLYGDSKDDVPVTTTTVSDNTSNGAVTVNQDTGVVTATPAVTNFYSAPATCSTPTQ
jgi:hypothetical protein